MNRWVAGGMAWPLVATRYHDGTVFHAGSPEASVNAATENGLWVACIRLVVLRGRSPANASRNTSALMYRSMPWLPSDSGYRRRRRPSRWAAIGTVDQWR